jgi:hypothetical protein
MIGQLESGIDPCSPDISCELAGPGSGANTLHMEVFGNIACKHFRLQYDASSLLFQENSPAKLDLDIVQSFDVAFSSGGSVYEFQANRDTVRCGTIRHWE